MATDDKFYMGNTNLPKVGSEFNYTPAQVKNLKKAIKDINFFAEKYFYIIAPGKGRESIQHYNGVSSGREIDNDDNLCSMVCLLS